eukprot:g1731.t1
MTFPLLSFSHGDLAGWPITGFAYGNLLKMIASHGFVVLAHESCQPSCENEQWIDQVHSLEWAIESYKNGTAASHPVLKHVNFTAKFGVFGHSTGGRSSIQSAAFASSGKSTALRFIGASVGLNPDPCVGNKKWKHSGCTQAFNVTTVPIAIFTGTGDTIEPKGSAKANYDAFPTKEKIFAQVKGVSHVAGGSEFWAGYVASFFKVMLDGNKKDKYYERIYGSGSESLCHGSYLMEQCIAGEKVAL